MDGQCFICYQHQDFWKSYVSLPQSNLTIQNESFRQYTFINSDFNTDIQTKPSDRLVFSKSIYGLPVKNLVITVHSVNVTPDRSAVELKSRSQKWLRSHLNKIPRKQLQNTPNGSIIKLDHKLTDFHTVGSSSLWNFVHQLDKNESKVKRNWS